MVAVAVVVGVAVAVWVVVGVVVVVGVAVAVGVVVVTTIDRIRRTLDARGPFPARLRRPDVPCDGGG